jgi:hypothetical protein
MRLLNQAKKWNYIYMINTSNNYEFIVCNMKDSTDCQSGSIVNIADTNTQVAKAFSCLVQHMIHILSQ